MMDPESEILAALEGYRKVIGEERWFSSKHRTMGELTLSDWFGPMDVSGDDPNAKGSQVFLCLVHTNRPTKPESNLDSVGGKATGGTVSAVCPQAVHVT